MTPQPSAMCGKQRDRLDPDQLLLIDLDELKDLMEVTQKQAIATQVVRRFAIMNRW